MAQWKYDIISGWQIYKHQALLDYLNEMGAANWELIHTDEERMIFKREVEITKKGAGFSG